VGCSPNRYTVHVDGREYCDVVKYDHWVDVVVADRYCSVIKQDELPKVIAALGVARELAVELTVDDRLDELEEAAAQALDALPSDHEAYLLLSEVMEGA